MRKYRIATYQILSVILLLAALPGITNAQYNDNTLSFEGPSPQQEFIVEAESPVGKPEFSTGFLGIPYKNPTTRVAGFAPDPCPIINGQDAAWACFDGTYDGTTMSAIVGDATIGTITAVGPQTTFAPNALQEWASGVFSGDKYNGPQVNPTGNSGDATSFDIEIPSGIPSDAVILAFNRLRPASGNTSYTLEAYDSGNTKLTVNDWLTGQGTDGGVCTNTVNLVYTNGNTTVEIRPTVSANSACSSSSVPVWFRITDTNVDRIEIRKVDSQPDNIHFGMAIVADFGDAPTSYYTRYSAGAVSPAFHFLSNSVSPSVYFGAGVDGDGNGAPGPQSQGDDNESSGMGNGDDEDAISVMPGLTTDQTSYSVTLVCTDGGNVGGWVDFDRSGSFDVGEYDSGTCASGSVTLNWSGLSGLTTGTSHARFRIASSLAEISNPTGNATDGEVEDHEVTISVPPTPDLRITKTVNNSKPIEGEQITFTIGLKNTSDTFDASGIQLTDQLPPGITYVSSSTDQGTYTSGTGIWDVGSVAAEDSVTLQISATVNTGTLGNVITNTAQITGLNETDPELSNNSQSAGITVSPEKADIAITKSADKSAPTEGAFVDYTITVVNNGPKTATNLEIIDQLPTGLEYLDDTPSTGSYNTSTGIWDIGTLANGASVTLTIETRVESNTEGSAIDNTAALHNLDQEDPNASDNSATASINVVPPSTPTTCNDRPLLTFENETLISGIDGQVGAVYKFPNVMSGVYAEVEIITIYNADLKDIDDEGTSGLPNDFSPFIENQSGDDGYIDFEIRFYDNSTDFSRYLSFTATTSDVDGTGNLRDFVGYENLTSFTVENTTELVTGAENIYTTFVSNNYNDTRPEYSNYSEYKVYATYTNEPTFKLRTGMKSDGTVDDRIVSVNFDPCEINNFNNPVTTDVVDIAVTKSVDDNSPEVGDTITYTIQATNNEGKTVNDVEINDDLPSGLTFVSSNPSQGTYNSSTGIWDIGNMSGLQTATLQLSATIQNGEEGETITNTASLYDVDGLDGFEPNNSASVDILVYDSGSGLSCNEPPMFSFNGYTLEQGVDKQVNAIYRFNNIASGLDALVKIKQISNAVLNELDNNSVSDSPANFSPLFETQNGTSNGYIDWEITIVQTGTTSPVKRNFSMTGLDIDGWQTGGESIRDYLGFAQNVSNTVESGTNLTLTTEDDFEIFASSTTTDASGSFDTDHMAYITYQYTSELEVRTGSMPTGGYDSQRLVDIDFRGCLNEEFDNPVVTNRNADLQVIKTVDEANPLENETINYTVTVTNNGPEDATEVDIHEDLPSDLSLVEAVPSQGTYNQITDTWALGTLNSGSSATLALETTVNSGNTGSTITNKAHVLGFNQHDPNINNDTSEVAVDVSTIIEGTIFHDLTGDGITDGDTNFGDASGDQQAAENVELLLFKDGGDGAADGSDDTYIKTETTDNEGYYAFQIGENGTYWIAVNSKTGDLSDGTSWAEQTYAPGDGICSDGAGGSSTLGSAGNCFGGRRGDVSDNISSSPSASDVLNAEHIAKVNMTGSQISDIDFGFSFNVVTNIDDGDDDGSAGRSIQGSLRQFIQNANQESGANTMRFVPAVSTNQSGSGGSWWSVSLTSELPALTDPLTTVDGTAFDRNAPLSEEDTNTGSVGSGGSVGTDGLSLNTFERKELEINLNDAGNNAFRINSTGAITVRDIALYNNSIAISLSNTTGGLIEHTLIGSRADGTDPGGSSRVDDGVSVNGSSSLNILIRENYIVYASGNGAEGTNANSDVTFYKNEFYKNALSDTDADGLQFTGSWTIEQNLIHQNGNGSSSSVSGGAGIEFGSSSATAQNVTIRDNSILQNNVTGITVIDRAESSLIETNIIAGNGDNYSSGGQKLGAGVRLSFPNSQSVEGIRISQNSFYNNHGISIDVVTTYGGGSSGQADGVTPNDGSIVSGTTEPNQGLDYPMFTLATIESSDLKVEGFIGTNATKLSGTYTVEIYKADDDGNNDGLIEEGGSLVRPHGEGRYYIGTITTNSDGTFNESIAIPGGISLATNDRITAIAINSGSSTSEFSSNQRIVPTGVSVSGYVYTDTNHNSVKENTENGLQSITVVLYNVSENNCKSVLTDSDGYYEFTNVLNGDYEVIEAYGQSIPTPDVCTPAAIDPNEHISTSPNVRPVEVNNNPATMNFGDFLGSRIQGTVFNDNGIGSGVANDAIQNGTEGGISQTGFTIKAKDASDILIDESVLNASGGYTLFIPKSEVANGGTVKVIEESPASYTSTGGDAGNTGGSYTIATDIVTFLVNAGDEYTGVNFADVQISTLLTDGQQNQFPGATATFTHQFIARTAGSVLFEAENGTANSNPVWPVNLYQDSNCNGTVDSGEPALDGSTAITVSANQTVCLAVKVTVPMGVQAGSTNNVTIKANFTLANTSPEIKQDLSRTDLVIVSETQGGLVIMKAVDKAQAIPGAVLTYSIDYQNNGNQPITSLEITDDTPAYTSFQSAACANLPNDLTACTITDPGSGQTGVIKWVFSGSLMPGSSGTITYSVKIDD